MKKLLVIAGVLCCLFFALSSCGSGDTTQQSDTQESAGTADESMDSAAGQAQEAPEGAEAPTDQTEESTGEGAE